MKRITKQECEVPHLILNLPQVAGDEQDEQDALTSRALALIFHHATTRYRMDRDLAVRFIEDDTPMPPDTLTDIRWPHDGVIYVEYEKPIVLDRVDQDDEDELQDFMNGISVVPSPSHTTIFTLGTVDYHFSLTEHIIRRDGSLTNPDEDNATHNPMRDIDYDGAQRFYARLAIHMSVESML